MRQNKSLSLHRPPSFNLYSQPQYQQVQSDAFRLILGRSMRSLIQSLCLCCHRGTCRCYSKEKEGGHAQLFELHTCLSNHLGILDIQRGQHKLVQKVSSSFYFILCRYTNKTHVSCLLTQLHQGDNVIFSGTIKKEVSNVSQLDSTITLRDIFRNVRDVKNPACYTS